MLASTPKLGSPGPPTSPGAGSSRGAGPSSSAAELPDSTYAPTPFGGKLAKKKQAGFHKDIRARFAGKGTVYEQKATGTLAGGDYQNQELVAAAQRETGA